MKLLHPIVIFVAAAVHIVVADETPLAIARELTNPFADRISLPINQNPDFGIGEADGWQYTLTLQPVIPIHLNSDWNIISRTVLPVVYRDVDGKSDFGLGDTAQSFFLSPTLAEDSGWCWGAGPIFLLPTATVDKFGSDQWSMGPTVGLLNRCGPWTYGALTNHTWSLSGREGRGDVCATFLQPFVDYTFESRTTLSLNTESTYNWNQKQWTTPINFVVRQLFDIGGQQISVGLGVRYYAEAPDGGAHWGARLGITIVFPK